MNAKFRHHAEIKGVLREINFTLQFVQKELVDTHASTVEEWTEKRTEYILVQSDIKDLEKWFFNKTSQVIRTISNVLPFLQIGGSK